MPVPSAESNRRVFSSSQWRRSRSGRGVLRRRGRGQGRAARITAARLPSALWAEETRRKYRHHAEAKKVEEQAGDYVVTAHLTGDFPGSPVDLRYRFKLKGPQIVSLDIG